MSRELYKMVAHSWVAMNGTGKQKCSRCGLVRLRNPLTDWCIAKGCYHEDHPQYKAKTKQLCKTI